MVNIAVAGGTGNVASVLLRSVIASDKHHVTILTRSSTSIPATSPANVSYKVVEYTDKDALVAALRGIEVCLSFFVVHLDAECAAQKNLIQACISAGVGRFAPSEWGIKNGNSIPEYENKDKVAEYLAELNAKEAVLEYCLFQPSIFMDYYAHPYSPNQLFTFPFFIDYSSRRAVLVDEGDQPIVLTSTHDDGEVLRLAIEDARPWPVVGGIRGCRTTMKEILEVGKKLRGGEWRVEHVTSADIERGELKTEWIPKMDHPSIPVEHQEAFAKKVLTAFLQAMLKGSWDVSDEWNQRLPDYKFEQLEEFLGKVWQGRD